MLILDESLLSFVMMYVASYDIFRDTLCQRHLLSIPILLNFFFSEIYLMRSSSFALSDGMSIS